MSYFERLLEISSSSEHNCFLFGPRNVGKTSWLEKYFPKAIKFDLLSDKTYTDLLGDSSHLASAIPNGFDGWVVIDEIQKIPNLLDEVHRLIESQKYRFILTGSSARKLRRGGVNLLAGRAFIKNMYPVTAVEQGDAFSLQKSLRTGHLPTALTSDESKEFLESYIATYLREEVMQEGLVRNIAIFKKFLEVASFSQGEMLNYTLIASECGSNRHTVENYFEILEDLLIAYRIPVFSKKAKRDLVKTSKFYLFDVGVFRTIRPKGPLDSESEIDRAALETLFLQDAIAINGYQKLGYEFFYWRTRTQIEVDFVLYGELGLLAFEVKRKTRLKSGDFRGLTAFMNDYPAAQTFMLYGGDEAYFHNGIMVVPLSMALKSMDLLLGDTAKFIDDL